MKYVLVNDFNDSRFEICSVVWNYILIVLWSIFSWNIRFVVSSKIFYFINLIFVHIQKWVKRTISLLRHVSTCTCLVQIILTWSRFFVAFEVLLLCCGFHYHRFFCCWCSFSATFLVCMFLVIVYFKSFVASLYIHCCMTLICDVALVLDYVACALGVFQSLCSAFSFIRWVYLKSHFC